MTDTTGQPSRAYYNEIDPYAAAWLRNLISAGHIPAGDVDERSIVDVVASDLHGYSQCHFFAGIGGWSLAARLAGWPDDRELWTGSCPCQPFSVAGKGAGADDERHLWPHMLRLLRARRPAVWMGEQVAAAVGKHWLDGVLADLEGIDYAGRAVVIPACAVNAPHRRDRLWIVAERGSAVDHGKRSGLEGLARHGDGAAGWAQQDRSTAEAGCCGAMGDADCDGRESRDIAAEAAGYGRSADAAGWSDSGDVADRNGVTGVQGSAIDSGRDHGGGSQSRSGLGRSGGSGWADADWILCHDGKARRVPGPESGIRLLAHGVPARVGKLRAYGNAIVSQVAAEVIAAYMDIRQ